MQQRIEELREKLNLYNYKYYVEAAPQVSDYEYDMMLKELQDLEAQYPQFFDPNSPTQRVGSDLQNAFNSVEHRFPMLSLSNTYSLEELSDFVGRIEREEGPTEFVCELKFDGTAISLAEEDLLIEMVKCEGFESASDRGITVVLDIRLTPELVEEGYVREMISKIQTMRKESGFDITDRIAVFLSSSKASDAAVEQFRDYICNQVLADTLVVDSATESNDEIELDDATIKVTVAKV